MSKPSPAFFFGAYVANISSSIGWGGDSGVCNLTLVEDPDNGILFKPPAIGSPCKFSYFGFSFGGIFTRYTYKESVTEGRTYEVILESPGKILDGVYIVLNRWNGTIYKDDNNVGNLTLNPIMTNATGVNNIINIFGKKENVAYGGKFGAADNNSVGYPVANIVADIKATINGGVFGSKIVYSEGVYDLDLDGLNTMIAAIPDYRVQGDFIGLSSLIKDIAELSLSDYILTVDGPVNSSGVITSPKIKLKYISRKSPPDKNVIQKKIAEYLALPDESKILSSYSVGKELTDVSTQKILLGAPVSRVYVADRYDLFPIWGSKGAGANTVYYFGNNILDYDSMYTPIRVNVDGGYDGNFTYVDTEILELRCALDTSRKAWSLYHILKAIQRGEKSIMYGSTRFTLAEYQKILSGEGVGVNDLIDTSVENAQVFAQWLYGYDTPYSNLIAAQKEVEARWSAVSGAANQFYGTDFLVKMPMEPGGEENNFRWVRQDIEADYSWNIVSSAWCGSLSEEFPDKQFYDDNQRLKMTVVYPKLDNADYSVLQGAYMLMPQYESVATYEGVSPDLDFNIRFMNKSNFQAIERPDTGGENKDSAGKKITSQSNDTAFIKIKVPRVMWYDQWATQHNGFNALCNLVLGPYYGMIPVSYHNQIGFENIDMAMPPLPLIPYNVLVPQQATRYVYGPWFAFGAENGKKGRLDLIQDEMYAPETFGSTAKMNEVAESYVNSELADLFASESGYVELAEEPKFNIGDKLFESGPYITSISININPGGMTTTYSMATWTRRNARLAKYNADRIARSQKQSFKEQKKVRELFRQKPFRSDYGAILSAFEKRQGSQQLNSDIQKYSAAGMFGNFINGAAQAIDKQNGELPRDTVEGPNAGSNMHASPFQGAARGVMANYNQSAGQSWEQTNTFVRISNPRLM